MKVSKLINNLEFFYPKNLAENWDNVGLLIGDSNKEITSVLTTLEVTLDVVFEAVERDCNMIVCHHPIIFKAINNLNYNDPVNNIIRHLIQNDIAVYCMHTNVDIADNGMNDWLSDVLNIKNKSILQTTNVKNYKKIIIETTKERLEDCIDLMKRTSIGQKGKKIQNYNITPKVKYYKDIDSSASKKDILTIESFVKEDDINEVKELFLKNKVFNFQILTLDNLVDTYGLGRIGTTKVTDLEQLANKVKLTFALDHVKIVGSREQTIKKIAICGGSGSSLIKTASARGVDCLITGDIGFHDAQLALSLDLALIDAGHYIEIIFNDYMADFISNITDVTALSSEIDTNPFEVIS